MTSSRIKCNIISSLIRALILCIHNFNKAQCIATMLEKRFLLRTHALTALSIFIEQLLIINHTIFMQVEAALLWWRHKNNRINAIWRGRGKAGGRGGGGGGGGRRDTIPIGIHIPVYMNRVLPK